ncbi:hypothetical protein BOVA514_2893 [Bacteroides ovatus]|nr:hypothetical protein BOVA514_2893 [Bacteroides ovatus]
MKGLPLNLNYIMGGLKSNRERCGSYTLSHMIVTNEIINT